MDFNDHNSCPTVVPIWPTPWPSIVLHLTFTHHEYPYFGIFRSRFNLWCSDWAPKLVIIQVLHRLPIPILESNVPLMEYLDRTKHQHCTDIHIWNTNFNWHTLCQTCDQSTNGSTTRIASQFSYFLIIQWNNKSQGPTSNSTWHSSWQKHPWMLHISI